MASQRFTVTKADEESRIGEKTQDNGSYGAVPINSVQLNITEGILIILKQEVYNFDLRKPLEIQLFFFIHVHLFIKQDTK